MSGGPSGFAPAFAPPVRHQAEDPARRQLEDPAHGWSLRDFIELGALDGSIPSARYHVRHILREWQLSRLGDEVELVVAELVTNAVAASRAMDFPFPVRLWLLSDTASVLVVVGDASPQPPVLMAPAEDAEVGRGLLLVEAVSARWDWQVLADGGGKVVRALITG
jgi:anti-sigma regulatory factor (Ser/Thr protein kinase)